MSECHFDKEKVGLFRDFVRGNDKSDVSSKKRPCFVKGCINTVISAAVAVSIAVAITACAVIAVVIQVAVKIDECCLLVVSIQIMQHVLILVIVGMVFLIASNHGMVGRLTRAVFVIKFDPGVKH